VGVNGRVWVNAGDVDTCVLVMQALQATAAGGGFTDVQVVRDLLARRDKLKST
jgi:exosome complex RNA-binding protein Rrp4